MEPKAGKLFDNVVYFSEGQETAEIKQLLKNGGAKREFYLTDMVTHVLSFTDNGGNTADLDDVDAPVLSPAWVTASHAAGSLLPCNPFLKSKAQMIFSGVVACVSQMTVKDRLSVWAMVTYYGGSLSPCLDTSCTHLILPQPLGPKYMRACQRPDQFQIVTPHWLLDCIREGRRLPEANYLVQPLAAAPPMATDTSAGTCDDDDNTYYSEAQPDSAVHAAIGVAARPAIPTVSVNLIEDAAGVRMPLGHGATSSSVAQGRPANLLMAMEDGRSEASSTITGSTDVSPPMERQLSTASDCWVGDGGVSQPASAPFLDPRFSRHPSKLDERTSRAILTRHQAAGIVGVSPMKDVSPSTAAAPPRGPQLSQPVLSSSSEITPSQHTACSGGTRGDQAAPPSTSEQQAVCPECVLKGTVFVFTDYQDSMDLKTLQNWRKIVVEHGAKVVEDYSPACTHVLAMNQQGHVCKQAIRDGKKVVTAHWLNDVLEFGRVFTPTLVLHFPTAFRENVVGCQKMVISLSGYVRPQRLFVRDMVQLVGAEFTSALSRENTHLVCKKAEGMKYERAVQWNLAVVNGKWLADLIMTNQVPDATLPQYSVFGREDELNASPNYTRVLLSSWMPKPKEVKVNVVRTVLSSPERVGPPPAKRSKPETFRILFTTLPVALGKQLRQIVRQLGGTVVQEVMDCTHLVAKRVARTIKFMAAVSVAQHILDASWVLDSKQEGKFLSEGLYQLRDDEGERQMNFSLAVSLHRRQVRNRPLLHGLSVYCTATVEPPADSILTIIQSAGGTLLTAVPSEEQLAIYEQQASQDRPALVVLSTAQDIKLCRPFIKHNIDIYTTELILESVLLQEIDFRRNLLIAT